MNLKSINIFLILILFGFCRGNFAVENSGIQHINNIIEHANRLVREKNFKNAAHFYDMALQEIDSVEASGSLSSGIIETVREIAANHFANFINLVENLGICFESEDKLFLFDKKDFDLNSLDSEKIDYKPFPDTELKSVNRWIERYKTKNRSTFQTYLDRSRNYIEDIKKVFRHFGLPEELAYVPMAESGFSPFAHSHAKAAGLWQFIPSTARVFGLKSNWWEDERKDVIKSTIAAARFYKYLYRELGDWNLVMAAYNCGSGRVSKSIKKHNTDNFWSLTSLPKETKDYVPRIRALVTLTKDSEKYDFSANSETALHDTVMLDSCVSLNAIAKALEISYEDIKKLNPQLKQWTLPPYAKNYAVVVPARSKVKFRERFRSLEDHEIYPVSEYLVKKGDNLKKTAGYFKVNPAAVSDLNPSGIQFNAGEKIKLLKPPTDQKWFTEFNNRYLTYYDGEEYYLEGRKSLSYTVRKGDSVWSISKKLKVNSQKLKAWNKIGNDNIVKPGQTLVVYL
jgi:membrane-bound lytic murein transglycosylase D